MYPKGRIDSGATMKTDSAKGHTLVSTAKGMENSKPARTAGNWEPTMLTPWQVGRGGRIQTVPNAAGGCLVIVDEDSVSRIFGGYIVQCVNAHADLLAALEAATERMEAVAASIPVANRAKGVSQATHVLHMAGHLAQHAKIARAAIAKASGE